jgi:type IV pilus assembly protein PilV
MNQRRKTKGFTMMEVMVAIIIIAIGLLGIAGLQLLAIRNTTGAGLRTVATQLAYDIVDRMRANQKAVVAGYYSTLAAPSASPPCYTGTCTPQQLAALDMNVWLTRVQAVLPAGQAIVCQDSTAPEAATSATAATTCDNVVGSPWMVKIFWTELNEEVNPPAVLERVFVTSFLP